MHESQILRLSFATPTTVSITIGFACFHRDSIRPAVAIIIVKSRIRESRDKSFVVIASRYRRVVDSIRSFEISSNRFSCKRDYLRNKRGLTRFEAREREGERERFAINLFRETGERFVEDRTRTLGRHLEFSCAPVQNSAVHRPPFRIQRPRVVLT